MNTCKQCQAQFEIVDWDRDFYCEPCYQESLS